MISNDYQAAVKMFEHALHVSRAAFESAIADAARHFALVPLGR
jgi:hypothetical protein